MEGLAKDYHAEFSFGYWGSITERFLKKLEHIDIYQYCESFFSKTDCMLLENAKAKFTPEYIFESFLKNKNICDIFQPPINPCQYKKMLDEFIRFGTIFYFPESMVDKWFNGIINKYVFCITSSLMTFKFSYVFSNFLDNTVVPFFNECTNLNIEKVDDWTCKIHFNKNTFLRDLELPEDTQIDKVLEYIKYMLLFKGLQYERPNYSGSFMLNLTNDIDFKETEHNYTLISKFAFLMSDIGFVDWAKNITTEHLGLTQLLYIISEVKDNMTINEKIMWINRAVDVFHFFSDLTSFFMVGGQDSLNKISNGNFISNKA